MLIDRLAWLLTASSLECTPNNSRALVRASPAVGGGTHSVGVSRDFCKLWYLEKVPGAGGSRTQGRGGEWGSFLVRGRNKGIENTEDVVFPGKGKKLSEE